MGIQIGSVDIANEIVELHYQMIRTQLLLDYVMKNNTITKPDQKLMQAFDNQAVEILQKKFPDMGIQKK